MEVLMLAPAVTERIWGGKRLITEFGFQTAEDNIGEAWMLSCHKDGPSYVLNGKYAGKKLSRAIKAEGSAVLGTHNAGRTEFPILIKLIDAEKKLSIQVHPDDEYAQILGKPNGKTEAWYILDAAPKAELVYGVNREVTKEEFSASIRKKALEPLLNTVPVKSGDVVFIPAGMLHAIGEGIFLAEVQQSSNTTFRVYDYNRLDKKGKRRRLHIKRATEAVHLEMPAGGFKPAGRKRRFSGGEKTFLTGCAFFTMTRLTVNGTFADSADDTSFVSLVVLNGAGTLLCGTQELTLKKGSSVFIPAGKGAYTLQGNMEILETRT